MSGDIFGKVTAYEMLRLLEERGLVTSEYFLHDEEQGPGRSRPGRSSVLFRPTAEGIRLLKELEGGLPEEEDWDALKERILSQLQPGDAAGYKDLLENLLSRIPEQVSALVYLTEMTTATLLALREMKDSAETGGLAGRVLAALERPGDGMAVDTKGRLYVTQPALGSIVILSPGLNNVNKSFITINNDIYISICNKNGL